MPWWWRGGMGWRNLSHTASGADSVKAGVPVESAVTFPSTSVNAVVVSPEAMAKHTDHGPAQAASEASSAQAARQAACGGNGSWAASGR